MRRKEHEKKYSKWIVFIGLAIIGILIFCNWYFNYQRAKTSETYNVSIMQLITNPEKYNGRKVQITGIGCVDFEDNAVYFSQDDYKYLTSENALWLVLSEEEEKKYKQFNGQHVLINGTFNMNVKGFMGVFPGAIESIERYTLMEPLR